MCLRRLVRLLVLVRRWSTVALVFVLVLLCGNMFVLAMAALLVLVLVFVAMVRRELKQGRLLLVLQVRLEMEGAWR